MKTIAYLAICMMGIGLTACQSTSPTIDGKTHEYSLKQKCPALLEMNVGEVLVFSTEENPTTGYQWKVLEPLSNFKVEETYLQNEVEEGVVGAGGIKTFRFVAEKPGQQLIKLAHMRPWEATEQPTQTWQCRIRIS